MDSDAVKMKVEIESMRDALNTLQKVVLLGNGSPSLVSRVSTIETKLATISRLLWLVVGGVTSLVVKAWFG